MTSAGGALEVLRAGRVAVIESASETAHYPQINRGVLAGIDLPWLQLEYFDESELGALLHDPLEERFAAIVFTPGAMALPRVRSILDDHAADFAQALAGGVGVVITATTLGGLERFDLAFLPEGSQVSLIETEMREMTGTLTTDSDPADIISAVDGQRAYSSLSLAAGHAFGWAHTATLHRAAGPSETVMWRAQFGLGRVIVSVLPFEWIGRVRMVENSLTRATRNRGILVVGTKSAPPWYGDLAPGQFLARLPDPAAAGKLLRDFSHLRLCADVDWSALDELERSKLLARLENSGTVEFLAQGPGGAIYARLDGVPRYLQRLRDAQTQLLNWIEHLPSSPTFHLLALALLSEACEQVVRGRLYIPDLLRRDTVADVVRTAMSRRVANGSVDGLLLPTVNLLAACSICDVDDSAAVTMAAWIAMYADNATADQRAQARWVLRAAGRIDLLDLVAEPQIPAESMLGQLACQLDDGQLEPPGQALASAQTTTFGALSDLDCSLLAYTHARWGNLADAEPIWDVLGSARHSRPERADAPFNNIEELCYRTAAEIMLDLHTPLTIHPDQAHPPADPAPRSTTDLLTQQALAEVQSYQERQARDVLVTMSRTARAMAGALGVLVIAIGLFASSLPLWLPEARNLGQDVRLTLAIGTFVVLSAALTMTLSTNTAQLVAPAWLRALGRVIHRLRA